MLCNLLTITNDAVATLDTAQTCSNISCYQLQDYSYGLKAFRTEWHRFYRKKDTRNYTSQFRLESTGKQVVKIQNPQNKTPKYQPPDEAGLLTTLCMALLKSIVHST